MSTGAVLVTGGASGLGLASARRLAASGRAVAIVDVESADPQGAAASLGASAIGLCADVTRMTELDDAVRRAEEALGPLDGAVTSAGVSAVGSVLDTEPADFDRIVAVNLFGTFLTVQQVARRMARYGGGSIVLIASITGSRAWNDRVAYAASKGGVLALARSCAVDLAPYHIRVNSVSPGPVATPQTSALHGPTIRRAIESAVPLGRYATTEEIAGTVAFLLSDEAQFVSGHDLVVDGALTAASIRYDRSTAERDSSTCRSAPS